MKKLIIITTVVFCFIVMFFAVFYLSPQKTFYRFGYIRKPIYTYDWNDYNQLFDGTYTHVLLAFLEPQSDATFEKTDALTSFTVEHIDKAHANDVQVMASIGGAQTPFAIFIEITRNEEKKNLFLERLVTVVQEMNLDGIDMNFEGWSSDMTEQDTLDINDFAVFLAHGFKAQFPDKVVTITLPASYWLSSAFSCDTVNNESIDFAHHMSYDFAEKGSEQPNAPMWNPQEKTSLFGQKRLIEKSIQGSLKYLFDHNCKKEKLLASIPFYSSGGDRWHDISRIRNWRKTEMNAFFLEKAFQKDGLTYWADDPESVQMKTKIYNELGLAGVTVWEVGHEGPAADLSDSLVY